MAGPGQFNRAERTHATRFFHRGSQLAGNGPIPANVSKHHAFLHGPRIIADNEANQAVVAVFAADGVPGVNGLAFDKKRVELGQDRTRLPVVMAEPEAEIGRLGESCSIEIRRLSLPYDRIVEPPIESGNAAVLAEIVFDD